MVLLYLLLLLLVSVVVVAGVLLLLVFCCFVVVIDFASVICVFLVGVIVLAQFVCQLMWSNGVCSWVFSFVCVVCDISVCVMCDVCVCLGVFLCFLLWAYVFLGAFAQGHLVCVVDSCWGVMANYINQKSGCNCLYICVCVCLCLLQAAECGYWGYGLCGVIMCYRYFLYGACAKTCG